LRDNLFGVLININTFITHELKLDKYYFQGYLLPFWLSSLSTSRVWWGNKTASWMNAARARNVKEITLT